MVVLSSPPLEWSEFSVLDRLISIEQINDQRQEQNVEQNGSWRVKAKK